ncbi:MAG TPA: sugar-binding protein [Anaerolineaceae bacterium]|nr:sugar-binding protein [Anaerolineaceae bacterium]
MFKKMILILVIGAAIFSLAGCNLLQRTPTADPNAVSTMVMQTVAAELTQAAFNTAVAQLTPITGATNTPVPAPVNTNTPIIVTAVPTATSVPVTATPLKPTATPTSAYERTGGAFSAAYLSTPPKMDGVWDEWTTTKYPARSVVYGRGDWKDADDLEGSFRVGWDNNNLYVAFKMIDDEYVQNATGADLYKGDSLEILIDTNLNADFSVTELNSDDYQIGISPGKPDVNGTREAYVWYPASVAGPRTQIQIASARGAGVTRIEVAIPWTVLGITPSSGLRLGFVVSASDNDSKASNVQQSMVSSASTRKLTDTSTWGILTLK